MVTSIGGVTCGGQVPRIGSPPFLYLGAVRW
jgi:hypothetical protein